MVKNWADHCSSDEEDVDLDDVDDEKSLTEAKEPLKDNNNNNATESKREEYSYREEDHDAPKHVEHGFGTKNYEYPTEPPYTLFVGNVPYSIVEPDELKSALTRLAHDLLNLEIVITHVRIMMENNARNNPHDNDDKRNHHRGFAYVQLETLEMLKAILQLNDTGATLGGRKLQLDTSVKNNQRRNQRQPHQPPHGFSQNRQPQLQQHHHRSFNNNNKSDNLPDGSNFRGGKFNSHQQPQQQQRFSSNSNNINNAATTTTSTTTSNNNNNNNNSHKERTSLRLAPRTKPTEESNRHSFAGNSNIFGAGKARDEQEYEKRKSVKILKKEQQDIATVDDTSKQHDNLDAEKKVAGNKLDTPGKAITTDEPPKQPPTDKNESDDTAGDPSPPEQDTGRHEDAEEDGGGETKWKVPSPTTSANNNNNNSMTGNRNTKGRGGRTGGGDYRGGRGGRGEDPFNKRGEKHRSAGGRGRGVGIGAAPPAAAARGGRGGKRDNDKQQPSKGGESTTPQVPAVTLPVVSKTSALLPDKSVPVEKKVVNKFAVLGFEDSDSD